MLLFVDVVEALNLEVIPMTTTIENTRLRRYKNKTKKCLRQQKEIDTLKKELADKNKKGDK